MLLTEKIKEELENIWNNKSCLNPLKFLKWKIAYTTDKYVALSTNISKGNFNV